MKSNTAPEPQIFGRYHILEPLAKGGMAQVFRARTAQGRSFILKKILKDYSENPDFVRMFLEEAKLSLSMKHPQIVRVVDFGQIDGSYFLAMEFVFGRDLSSVLKKCAELKIFIPIDVVCQMMYQCCLGLHYAHTLQDSFGQPLNIVHRDISPPNILVGYNGEVKILDFGIAKAVSSSRREETRSGVLKGKFSYMSPEQASGKPLTAQSDVFSLGTVFFELLTSKNLFYRPDELETLEAVKKAQIPSLKSIRGDATSDLEKLVLKALTVKTKNRYASAAEMSEDIRLFLHENYPHSDSREVARFLRKLFAQDFQNRLSTSEQDGWQDSLELGGDDNSLLLDESEPGTESQGLKPLIQASHLKWHERLAYDPHVVREVKRKALQLAALVAVFLAAFLGYDYFQKLQNPRAPSAEISPEIPLPTETAPVDTLQYWKDQGSLSERQKDYESAIRHYRRALDINPFDESLKVKLYFSELASGSLTSACEHLEASTQLTPHDRLLAEAYCAQVKGQKKRAFSAFSQFLSSFPEDPLSAEIQSILAALKDAASE